ncbi:MAG: tRNA (adenosine(37)-N6)-threonylcarbamoyltransferase complex dimerization subunit type 1 TsaB [Spirochaetaceae bacterium]|jgi:tRNA threonylcarbamoyladenosine biosynthesis protein TsaB|nr:tRNA (adenosine(37)-N6)-threonylcarbamoyltransferase complex dimerization subunit type 1 TsaB [Spirochaetaceae bacterium]
MTDTKTIIALDASTDILSMALAHGDKRYAIQADAGLSHSELLIPLLDSLVKLADIRREEISLVVCPRGPGSWTGLRIGYAAAQGIARALGVPSLTVPTLDLIAQPHKAFCGAVLASLDAKQARFFCALYRAGRKESAYLDAEPVSLRALFNKGESVLLTGNAAPHLYAALAPLCPENPLTLDPHYRLPRALELINASLAPDAAKYEGGHGLLYLRASDAELRQH